MGRTPARPGRRRGGQSSGNLAGYDGDLVLLEGGPRDGFWYDAQDWQRMREFARNMGNERILGYRRTRRTALSPLFASTGHIWLFDPQPTVSS